MLKFLKLVKVGFWVTLITLIAASFVAVSAIEYHTIPSWEDVITDDNVARLPADPSSIAIRKSRDSAVLVQSTSAGFWGGTSTMTGTYFVANSKPYVVTVHHGIHGPCGLIVVLHDDEGYSCKEYTLVDKENDYVIMEMETLLSNRTPVQIPADLPHGGEWKPSYSILNGIIYTGYPNTVGPLTLRGDVIGYGDEYVYVFSHAYGGASGSGVFTHDGKYIGYVVAIDVGVTEWGPDVLENIVIVAPAFNVDWSIVLN
jgi:hypothetical protein